MRAFPPLLLALCLALGVPGSASADPPPCDDDFGGHCDEDCFLFRPGALLENPMAAVFGCMPARPA